MAFVSRQATRQSQAASPLRHEGKFDACGGLSPSQSANPELKLLLISETDAVFSRTRAASYCGVESGMTSCLPVLFVGSIDSAGGAGGALRIATALGGGSRGCGSAVRCAHQHFSCVCGPKLFDDRITAKFDERVLRSWRGATAAGVFTNRSRRTWVFVIPPLIFLNRIERLLRRIK